MFDFTCHICLSQDRRLKPIKHMYPVYKFIVEYLEPEEEVANFKRKEKSEDMVIQMCWECEALLKKFLGFSEQAVRAKNLLQQCREDGSNYNRLTSAQISNLCMSNLKRDIKLNFNTYVTYQEKKSIVTNEEHSDIKPMITEVIKQPLIYDLLDLVSSERDSDEETKPSVIDELDCQKDVLPKIVNTFTKSDDDSKMNVDVESTVTNSNSQSITEADYSVNKAQFLGPIPEESLKSKSKNTHIILKLAPIPKDDDDLEDDSMNGVETLAYEENPDLIDPEDADDVKVFVSKNTNDKSLSIITESESESISSELNDSVDKALFLGPMPIKSLKLKTENTRNTILKLASSPINNNELEDNSMSGVEKLTYDEDPDFIDPGVTDDVKVFVSKNTNDKSSPMINETDTGSVSSELNDKNTLTAIPNAVIDDIHSSEMVDEALYNSESFLLAHYFKITMLNDDDVNAVCEEAKLKRQYLNSPYKCQTCIIGFYNAGLLADHNCIKHTEKLDHEACRICKVYVQKKRMKEHLKFHLQRYDCKLCSFTELKKNVKKHITLQHLKGHALTHAKSIRRIKFPSNIGYVPLWKLPVVKNNQITYQCDQCLLTFKDDKRKEIHMITVHGMMFECDRCQKKFTNRKALKTHLSKHKTVLLQNGSRIKKSRGIQRVYSCEECLKEFLSKELYHSHISTSSVHAPNGYRLTCEDCQWSFKNRHALHKHRVQDHKNEDLICKICYKVYISPNWLKRHYKVVH